MSVTKFNELKAHAKQLGINTKGMKMVDIEKAIAAATVKIEEEKTEISREVFVDSLIQETVPEATTPVKEETKNKPGRPVNPNSDRQKRITERLVKGEVKRGRPVIEGSARQKRLEKMREKMAAGLPIKPGRPKMERKEGDVVVVINDQPATATTVSDQPVLV